MKLNVLLVIAAFSTTFLQACSPPAQSAALPTLGAAAPQATSTPAGERLSNIPISQAALVARTDPRNQSMILVAVDPATGDMLQDHIPLEFSPNYRFTPDEHTLIYVSYPPDDPSRATLHFLDLASWQDDPAILMPSKGWPTAMAVSPDGTRFVMAYMEPQQTSLWLADVTTHRVLAHALSPLMFTGLQFTADGEGLMTYGRQETNSGLSNGPPIAQLLSLEHLDQVWSRTLASVRDGFEPNPGHEGDAHTPGAGTTYRPAVVFSPDEEILYIVHADVDKLTRVDFGRKTVLTLDIRPKLSFFERLLALSAGTAYAKGQEGIERQAVISPDGDVIYTVGLQNKVTLKSNGNWDFAQTPLNLQAISTVDAAEIFKSEAAGPQLGLSADGSALFLPQYYDSGFLSGTVQVSAKSGAIIGRYDKISLQSTRRLGGEPVLVSAVPVGINQSKTDMIVFTAKLQPLGRWTVREYAQWLIAP